MYCHDARVLLWFGHKPGELSADDAADLDRHLQECSPCRSHANSERRMDAAIARAMQAVPIPDGAQQRLVAELRRRAQTRRRWLGAAAAMAAAILVGVVFGGYWWLNQPIPLDIRAIGDEMTARTAVERKPESVTKWFAHNGFAIQAPTTLHRLKKVDGFDSYTLDYFQLHSVGFSEFQGVVVPHLLFLNRDSRNGGDLLHVYVLSDQQFDFTNLRQPPDKPVYSGALTVELMTGELPNFRYLVGYTSNNLQPFCKRNSIS